MKLVVTYTPTLSEAVLLILDKIKAATIGAFYPHPYYHAYCSHMHRRSLYGALERLERRALVGIQRGRGREEWALTPEGEQLVQRLKTKLAYPRQQRWDGKWRLVIFDIAERIRDRRNFLRRELNAFGLYQLQKSVWVTPYPLPDDFSEIVVELELGKQFRIVTADRISQDSDLRAHFFPSAR